MPNYIDIKPSGGDTGAPLNQRRRMELIQRYVPLQGKKMLDCGCGTGQYVIGFLNAGVDAYGIDFFKEKIQEFHTRYPEIADRVNVGNAEKINFPDDSFDVVLVNEVLEHIPDQVKALLEIRRILKPDGVFIVFSPNRFYPFETHGITMKKNRKEIPPYFPFIPYIPLRLGVLIFEYRARNYWPHELRELIKQQGFDLLHTGYSWQTFENISGQQPAAAGMLRLPLRKIFFFLETIPIIRAFGVSQMIIAAKKSDENNGKS